MPRPIELSVTLDSDNRRKLSPALAGAAGVIAPLIEYLHPASAAGRDEFCRYLGCKHDDLPDEEGWGSAVLNDLSSRCGTRAPRSPLTAALRVQSTQREATLSFLSARRPWMTSSI